MNIKGNKIILRAIEETDLEMLRSMVNSVEFEYNVVGFSFPISRAQQYTWYQKQLNSDNLKLIIEYEGEALGLATLENIDWKNRVASHGIKLLSRAQGKGIGTDAVKTICNYAFNELQLNRLEGGVLENNIASLKLYEKCGWKKEGIFKEYVFKNGKYLDYFPLAILKKEFKYKDE